jgi:hypothetical protein
MRRVPAKRSVLTSRRGITIIEVLVVATGVAMLLGLCAVSIQLLMKLNSEGMARFSAAASFERLARQVREDTHASETAQITVDDKKAGASAGLRLVFAPNHVVAYMAGDGGVIRTESRSDKVVRHETFGLTRGGGVQFEIREEGPRRLVALVVTRPAGKSPTEPPRPLEVLALQGKDRHESPAKQGGKPQ